MTIRSLAALTASCAALALPAHGAELYVPMGLPGIGLGLAVPVGPLFALRADFMTLGAREKNTVESGISYQGKYKLDRTALLADIFPFAGSFRLSAGAVSSNYKVTLDASGAGGSLTIGNRTYVTTAADGLNVQVTFPRSTPYLGLGWGHHEGSGLRFSADIGAAIGRAKVTAVPRGPITGQADLQGNIDKELADLRDGVGKVRAFPQLSFGIGYSV